MKSQQFRAQVIAKEIHETGFFFIDRSYYLVFKLSVGHVERRSVTVKQYYDFEVGQGVRVVLHHSPKTDRWYFTKEEAIFA